MCIVIFKIWTTLQKALNDHLPMVTIAALSGIGGGIVLLLPDTSRTDEKSVTGKK